MPRKADDRVIGLLTMIYTAEIGAVGIYMDQHFKMADAGYDKFAKKLEDDAVEEMKHAERVAKRILALGAPIKYEKHVVPLESQEEIMDIIQTNINLELDAIARLNSGVKLCFEAGDNVSRILVEEILVDEERHLDDYENMVKLIEKHGDQYIVSHLI